jgi:N-acetylneuraminate synthase
MRKRGSLGDGVYVIAEAGVNHNGSLELAQELVDAAADAGADAVKFQTFRGEDLATARAPKAAYQARTTGSRESQLQMLKKLELGPAAHRTLIARCQRRGLDFISSPFDAASMRLLTHTLRLPVLKIPSGEITNGPLLLQAARSGRRIILSTGMSVLAEIEAALGVLAFGLLGSTREPSRASFAQAYRSPAGQRRLCNRVVILHCVTDYPTRFEDVNLRAMDTLRAAFGLPVGLSDHSKGIAVPIAAAARGARVIEKHLTLDRNLPGPDHRASLEPGELAAMVAGVRQVEMALGDGLKSPTTSELRNARTARKSLVAARSIARGESYSPRNLTAKRAGGGRSPLEYWELIGKPAPRRLRKDEPVE